MPRWETDSAGRPIARAIPNKINLPKMAIISGLVAVVIVGFIIIVITVRHHYAVERQKFIDDCIAAHGTLVTSQNNSRYLECRVDY